MIEYLTLVDEDTAFKLIEKQVIAFKQKRRKDNQRTKIINKLVLFPKKFKITDNKTQFIKSLVFHISSIS